ncbi:FAR1 DNA binding domain, Zinc finger, SWIM-type, MULE transposase domain, FHY3/FAR1 family [Artemisia annua]|uniref:FAR1 DNA binding domain, Zinc finger, SWIM-type, MULE transposase domain, FHY3/FAR1 family n=1 Tax=Artemisia annua TaxID=35608 RepID=A0A2U1PXY4_ARTAN|nr:FAR1 DNA binding domain, Zinc finger, SWIM-type, MULE transposase domain, FHY3/FAR1 family [Artemisia annua]
MNLAGITMNPTDSSTKPSPTPDSSTNHHQKTHRNLANTMNLAMNLAGINKNVTNTMNLVGITMNLMDSSKNPPDSSINQSESSTNPSDSSIINDIDENHLIEVDLVTEGDLPEDEDEDATVKEVHGKIPWDLIFLFSVVLRTIEDRSVVCTCRHFARFGFLCRHIFCVFKNRDINVIPEQYILRRWTRDIIPPELRRKRNRYGEKMLGDKVEKMGDFVEKLKKLRTEVEAEVPNHPSIETGDVIDEHYAISKPDKKQLTIRQR